MPKRVLFLQCTNAGAYPPICNAAHLLADRGWTVEILSSPNIGTASIVVPPHKNLRLYSTRTRQQSAVHPGEFAEYTFKALYLATRLRPDILYVSDPLAAGPGLLSASVVGADLIYHEHDSPNSASLRPWIANLRRLAARKAKLVLFPNEVRGRIVQRDLGFSCERLRVVWNTPSLHELPKIKSIPDKRLILYYHGSITPERLPEQVIDAVRSFNGNVILKIAGYEAAGARGYLQRLLILGHCSDALSVVHYVGQVPNRTDLLEEASRCHVGLALMPTTTDDLNMQHMIGASNKVFDYMAAGLALVVSDLPSWRDMFVPEFARSCDPNNRASIIGTLNWFVNHPEEANRMASRGRTRIQSDWNYDKAFSPIIDAMSNL